MPPGAHGDPSMGQSVYGSGGPLNNKDPRADPELSSRIERLLQAEMMNYRAGIDPSVGSHGWSSSSGAAGLSTNLIYPILFFMPDKRSVN